MQLTAVMESWVIPDGSYPCLSVGMPVNLSFELSPNELSADGGTAESFVSMGDGEYSFSGRVLAVYEDPDRLAVVEAAGFCFYVEGSHAEELSVGQRVRGEGTLLVDYYVWVEYVGERAGAPDLFYDLVVKRIRRVQIPESRIHRHARGKSLPARVPPSEFAEVTELQTMEGQALDEEFYLLDLEGIDDAVPRTFLG